MIVRDMSLTRVLSASLFVLAGFAFATAFATAAPAPADPPQKKAEEKKDDGEQSDENADQAAKKSEAKDAEAQAETPAMGGDASVPRPRTRKPLPTKVDPKTGQKVFVLTNDGLVERFGEPKQALSSASVPYGETGTAAAAPGDEPSEDDPAAQRAVEIRRELRRHRANLLRFRNPLLPRPELTDDEKAAQSGRDNVERIAMTEDRIAELERELAELQAQGGAGN